MRAHSIFVTFVLLGLGSAARAQTFRSTPLGGRSTLMGGTGIAAGSDGAAPFQNPANALRVDANLTLAFGTLSLSSLRLQPLYQAGPSDPAFGGIDTENRSESQFRVEGVPSVLCVFAAPGRLPGSQGRRAGSQKISACFGVVDRHTVQLVGRGFAGDAVPLAQSLSFTRSWSRYSVAPSYALQITDEIAVGVTLPGFSTGTQILAANGGAAASGGQLGTSVLELGLDASSVDFGFATGIAFQRGGWSVGAVFQTEDIHLYGSGRFSDFRQTVLGPRMAVTARQYEGKFRATGPARAGWGVAYESPRWALAVDVNVTFPRTGAAQASFSGTTSVGRVDGSAPAQTSQTEDSLTVTDDAKPAVNVAIGTEYFTSPRLGLLGGFFGTFLDAREAPSLLPSRENVVGLSFGIGNHGDWGKLLLGVQASYGWGVTLVPNVWDVPPDEGEAAVRAARVLLVIAGDTSFTAIKHSVEDLVLDPLRAKPTESPAPADRPPPPAAH